MTSITTYRGHEITPQVLSAIEEASERSGVDFDYMISKAAQESGFNPTISASTSSATGLYQFINSTWLAMVATHGDAYGLDRYADQIHRSADGGYTVDDPAMRRRILDLRLDPRLNALMAGEFASDNARHLARTVGGEITSTDLYLAHFLGADGATRFLTSMNRDPYTPAADVFPSAARSNHGVFYDRSTGAPRTLEQVYRWIARRMDDDGTGVVTEEVLGDQPVAPSETRRPIALAGRASSDDDPEPLPLFQPSSITGDDIPPLPETGAFGSRAYTKGIQSLSLWAVLTAQSAPLPTMESNPGVTGSRGGPTRALDGDQEDASDDIHGETGLQSVG